MTFEATYWKSDPQLRSGGYWTERIITAETVGQAARKAHEIESCSMKLSGMKRVKKIA